MAPEPQLSPASDVWSLAIMLHEILTGMIPINEKTGYFEIMEEYLDPFLTKLLQRALRRDPKIRIDLIIMIEDLRIFNENCKNE